MSDINEEDRFVVDTRALGTPKVVGGRIEWTPPPKLNPAQVALITEAVRYFNAKVESGEFRAELTSEGEIVVIAVGEEG